MAYIYSKEEQAAGTGSFTRETLEDGVYDMKLVRISAYMRDGTAQYPDPTPTLRFSWAWCDDQGNAYENDEGKNYEVRDDVPMPTGFPEAMRYHEKTRLYKRLAEIAGVAIADQAAVQRIGVDPGEFIQSHADIIEIISSPMEGKPDRKGFVSIVGIAVDGVEQVGRICKIVVKKQAGKKDPTKFYNNVASIMQAQASQPKRPPARTAAPAAPAAQAATPKSASPTRPAVPAAQAAPTQSAPPARPARPAPAPAAPRPGGLDVADINPDDLPY